MRGVLRFLFPANPSVTNICFPFPPPPRFPTANRCPTLEAAQQHPLLPTLAGSASPLATGSPTHRPQGLAPRSRLGRRQRDRPVGPGRLDRDQGICWSRPCSAGARALEGVQEGEGAGARRLLLDPLLLLSWLPWRCVCRRRGSCVYLVL